MQTLVNRSLSRQRSRVRVSLTSLRTSRRPRHFLSKEFRLTIERMAKRTDFEEYQETATPRPRLKSNLGHPTYSWRYTRATRPQLRSALKSIRPNRRQVSFVESLPRDAYGKVLKRNLEERLQDFRLASAGAGQSGFAGVEVIVRGVS